MKLTLLLLALFAALGSQAQENYSMYYNYESLMLNNQKLSEDMQGVVKEVRIKSTYLKEKRNKSIQRQYNDNGLVTYYEINDRYGGLKEKAEANYNVKGNITHFKSYTQKGVLKERVNTYDEELRLTETSLKNKKGKYNARSTWTYGEDKCAIQSKSYKRDGEKLKRVWDYTYYSGCDRKKTTISNAKGKVIKTWSYDCKKEGEQLTKIKDETQVCKWEESDGKYLIRIFQNFDDKGKIRKTVQKYTIEDTLILETTTYDGEDRLKYKYTYDKSFDRQTSYAFYNKKGEKKYSHEAVFVDQKALSKAYFKKGKKTSETKYTYDENNWLTKTEAYDSKGIITKTEEFEYIR